MAEDVFKNDPKTIQKRLCFNNHFRILLPLKAKINKTRLNNFKILEVLLQVLKVNPNEN